MAYVPVQHRERGSDDRHGVLHISAEEDPANGTQRVIDHFGVHVDGRTGPRCHAASVRQARGLIGHDVDVGSDAAVGKQRRHRTTLLSPVRPPAGEQAVTQVRGDFFVVGRVLAVTVGVARKHLLDAVWMSHEVERATQ